MRSTGTVRGESGIKPGMRVVRRVASSWPFVRSTLRRCIVRKLMSVFMFFAAASFLAATTGLAGSLDDAAREGARSFADPGLGTNGKSCATCHGDGKALAGKAAFPKEALGGVRTLDQAIQVCVTNALAGKPLAWDDKRLSAVAVFLSRIYAGPAK